MIVDHLAVLAPGLLGASVARAARARGLARRITLWARRPEVREALREQPWCDAVADTAELAVHGADLVVLAAPVERIIELAALVGPHLAPAAVLTDVGSVKGELCRQVAAALPSGRTFIGAHPMAGGAHTGWEHATDDLFEKRVCFVTAPEGAPPAAVEKVTAFWRGAGAEVVPVAPGEHDRIVAHISHLPQVLATALAGFLAKHPGDWRHLAGNGLRDTTRIAASDATMWIEIFQQNRTEVVRALDGCLAEIQALRDNIAAKDWEDVRARLVAGKTWRDGFRP
ncbi:MAG: prephenate dehydrogenase/arogenate dehydrogenase family protein [Verrucomicrobiota bacterium]